MDPQRQGVLRAQGFAFPLRSNCDVAARLIPSERQPIAVRIGEWPHWDTDLHPSKGNCDNPIRCLVPGRPRDRHAGVLRRVPFTVRGAWEGDRVETSARGS